MFGMTPSLDRLVELIVKEDKQVLKELLTTDRFIIDGVTIDFISAPKNQKKLPLRIRRIKRNNTRAIRSHLCKGRKKCANSNGQIYFWKKER